MSTTLDPFPSEAEAEKIADQLCDNTEQVLGFKIAFEILRLRQRLTASMPTPSDEQRVREIMWSLNGPHGEPELVQRFAQVLAQAREEGRAQEKEHAQGLVELLEAFQDPRHTGRFAGMQPSQAIAKELAAYKAKRNA